MYLTTSRVNCTLKYLLITVFHLEAIMILTIDINITLTLQWICWGNRKSLAAYRVYALMSFQEVVLFCGTWFLVCHLHTSEVSHPQKKSSLLHWKSAGEKKNLIFPYPSHFPFFFFLQSVLCQLLGPDPSSLKSKRKFPNGFHKKDLRYQWLPIAEIYIQALIKEST